MPTLRYELSVRGEEDVVRVRVQARDLAVALGFDSFAVAAISTAASELTRNVWVHGGGGEAVVQSEEDGARHGIRMQFVDQGPGIADVDRAMRGGFSTRRSLGLGLSGTRRLVDEFQLESRVGVGTRVTIVKWAREGRH